MAILKTKTIKGGAVTEIEMDIFYLNQIPDAMERMGWEMAPKLMRHWFSIKPDFSFFDHKDLKDKYVRGDATLIPPERYNDSIVKMSWAKKYIQVQEGIEHLMHNWSSVNGIGLLKKRLMNNVTKLGYSDSVIELDTYAQVNRHPIGSMTDKINDYYGAIGKALLKMAVKGYVDKINNKDVFITESIGLYIKDTYDFVGDEEFLGVWGKNGVLSKTKMLLFKGYYDGMQWKELAGEYSGYVPIQNLDFRAWQKRRKEGGDFIVFSDVLWMLPLDKDRVIYL
ncbi:DUF6402 family protein [Photorhabdus tasmaniensis]|uniref:Uncharacterized protein n=1 Tax=Photorhabdus tasmaniensis TaxID=1004159 RepID=A0ABX0GHX8_9GAMM|nr:DUF6402 family protein [Photorhabdus tasmaniensis]NHB87878.1 hypothetical protein [Photorhabdus tasmaniensis]